jgi:inorganic pyrophosphatase
MDSPSERFWLALEKLVGESEVVIDRPKGVHHPQSLEITYPVDYGYLKDTKSMDNQGIDVWRGSDPDAKIDAIICTVDLRKKDSEIKILIGCTPEEKKLILAFHNRWDMSGILVQRLTSNSHSPQKNSTSARLLPCQRKLASRGR